MCNLLPLIQIKIKKGNPTSNFKSQLILQLQPPFTPRKRRRSSSSIIHSTTRTRTRRPRRRSLTPITFRYHNNTSSSRRPFQLARNSSWRKVGIEFQSPSSTRVTRHQRRRSSLIILRRGSITSTRSIIMIRQQLGHCCCCRCCCCCSRRRSWFVAKIQTEFKFRPRRIDVVVIIAIRDRMTKLMERISSKRQKRFSKKDIRYPSPSVVT